MHKKQHQRGFLFSSQLARGKRIQEAVEGSKDGVLKASLWRLDQKKAHTLGTSDETQLWIPNWGGGRRGWVSLTEGGGWNSLTAAITGPQGNIWPLGQRAPSSLDRKAQSHRGGPLTPGW